MAATTVTSKGQVTIPKAIREAMGVGPGDRVRFTRRDDGTVIVEAETVDVRTLKGKFKHRVTGSVSVEEMNEAIINVVAESYRQS